MTASGPNNVSNEGSPVTSSSTFLLDNDKHSRASRPPKASNKKRRRSHSNNDMSSNSAEAKRSIRVASQSPKIATMRATDNILRRDDGDNAPFQSGHAGDVSQPTPHPPSVGARTTEIPFDDGLAHRNATSQNASTTHQCQPLKPGQNRTRNSTQRYEPRRRNFEIRIPKCSRPAISPDTATSVRRSGNRTASAGGAQSLDVLIATQNSGSPKKRHGFSHRPDMRDVSMLRDREVLMPVACECIGLPPCFSSAEPLPTLDTWTGDRGEFFNHVAKIGACNGHSEAMRDHCRRLLADGLASSAVSS